MRRSGKQRKAELQHKRAVKRGEVAPPDKQPRKKIFRRPPKLGHTLDARQAADDASRVARKLQSQFVKLDHDFLEITKYLAATLPLPRPISSDICLLDIHALCQPGSDLDVSQLSVPKRPKWKYTMSKEEVDANEEGYFRKWITQTDALVERWHRQGTQPVASGADPGSTDQHGVDTTSQGKIPRPPTYFERNLEVWRQL
jgi:hypothetical protein